METVEYRLGDVCTLRNGYAFKSENFTKEGVPVIRISDINDSTATPQKAQRTTESSVFEKFVIKEDDILIAMSGATTGKFGRYKSKLKAYQNQRVGCFVITDESKLSNDYLYLLLKGLQKKIESDAYGGGQPNISSKIIENYKIQLPSLSDQQKIAGVLNKAERLIIQRQRSVELADEFLKHAYHRMFGDPSTNLNNYEVGKAEDIIEEVKYGTSKPSEDEGKFVYLRMNNITTTGFWDLSQIKYINVESSDIEKYIVRNNDLVFNRTNSKELVGKTAVFDLDEEMIIAGYLIRVRLNERGNPYFLWGYLNSPHGKKTLLGLCRNIVGMANINANELKNIKILLPPIELQNQFAQQVRKVKAIKEKYALSLVELEKLYNSLHYKAFKGELSITVKTTVNSNQTTTPAISDTAVDETEVIEQPIPSSDEYDIGVKNNLLRKYLYIEKRTASQIEANNNTEWFWFFNYFWQYLPKIKYIRKEHSQIYCIVKGDALARQYPKSSEIECFLTENETVTRIKELEDNDIVFHINILPQIGTNNLDERFADFFSYATEYRLSTTAEAHQIEVLNKAFTSHPTFYDYQYPAVIFFLGYVKDIYLKEYKGETFSFQKLWNEMVKQFVALPDYDDFVELLFKWLKEKNPFISQKYNDVTKQTELIVHEIAEA